MIHLPFGWLYLIVTLVGWLVGKFEPARLILGRQAIMKARQEDVPAVMEASAKWQSPPRAKLR